MTLPELLHSNSKVITITANGYLLVLFDEKCLLCNKTVHFLNKIDVQDQLRFAELGKCAEDPETIIVVNSYSTYIKSTAVIQILNQMKGVWRIIGLIIETIPLKIRDRLYDYISRNRINWFGRVDNCPIGAITLIDKIVDISAINQ